MSELDELLARAVELEQKATEAGDDDVADLAGDLDELAADAGGLDSNEPSAEDLAAFDEGGVDEGGDEWAGEADPEDLDEAGVDFDEPDDEPLERAEEKAAGWGPCPSCGSSERDEFDDDTARCSECGTLLSPSVSKKHYDFDDDLDEPAGPEVKSGLLDLDTMDEMDLLRARRLEL